jgi:HSP20 family protein
LNEEVLVVTASKEAKEEAKDEKLVRREFSVGAIERRFMLPKDLVDKDAISAKYDNGILTISIPKKEEVKSAEPRLIAVQ